MNPHMLLLHRNHQQVQSPPTCRARGTRVLPVPARSPDAFPELLTEFSSSQASGPSSAAFFFLSYALADVLFSFFLFFLGGVEVIIKQN